MTNSHNAASQIVKSLLSVIVMHMGEQDDNDNDNDNNNNNNNNNNPCHILCFNGWDAKCCQILPTFGGSPREFGIPAVFWLYSAVFGKFLAVFGKFLASVCTVSTQMPTLNLVYVPQVSSSFLGGRKHKVPE